jgi:hypothetical protein
MSEEKKNTEKATVKATITENVIMREFVTKPLPTLEVNMDNISQLAPFTGKSVSLEPDGTFKAGRLSFEMNDFLVWNGDSIRVMKKEEINTKMVITDGKK